MDPELKSKWVDALRSGKYKQGRGYLCRDDAYCCLGVLCDISGIGEWKNVPDENGLTYVTSQDQDRFGLPYSVREEIPESKLHILSTLACMNDDGVSFETIAKEIEEKL